MLAMDVLLTMLRKQMNDYADDIALGSATDYAEYRHWAGRIEGLAMAERFLLDIRERIDPEDDPDD